MFTTLIPATIIKINFKQCCQQFHQYNKHNKSPPLTSIQWTEKRQWHNADENPGPGFTQAQQYGRGYPHTGTTMSARLPPTQAQQCGRGYPRSIVSWHHFFFSCHPILILNCPLSLKVDIMRMAQILKCEAQPLQSSFKFDKFSTILPNWQKMCPFYRNMENLDHIRTQIFDFLFAFCSSSCLFNSFWWACKN